MNMYVIHVTYMFILKCALKLVLKNILYYDAWSEKHQIIHNKLLYTMKRHKGNKYKTE